jgi:hypothetical protein
VLDIIPALAEETGEDAAPASPQPPGEPKQPTAPPPQVPARPPAQPTADTVAVVGNAVGGQIEQSQSPDPPKQTKSGSGPLHT